jgi:hypothetical protein
VANEEKDAAGAEGQRTESERIAEDAFLTGAVGMGTTPRLTGRALRGGDPGKGSNLFEDDSWRSGAVEEGEPGEPPAKPKGFGARIRRFFGD